MKLDPAFTQKVQDFLALDQDKRDLEEGARLLLQMTRSKFLYTSIMRRKDHRRLERELTKYLRIRLDGLTRSEVYFLEKETLPRVRETVRRAAERYEVRPAKPDPKTCELSHGTKGKRADHDFLPEDIRALWDANGDIYRRMKQTFETLKGMAAQTACDRYELVKMLAELDTRYRDNLRRYDDAPAPDSETLKAAREAEAKAAAAADLGSKGTQEAAAAIIFGGEERKEA